MATDMATNRDHMALHSCPAGLLQASAFKTSHCPRRRCGTVISLIILSSFMGCEESESEFWFCLFGDFLFHFLREFLIQK